MAAPAFVTENLDRLESALPPIPARVLRLQRTVAGAICDRFSAVTGAVGDSSNTVVDSARVSGKVVTGQARAAGSDVVTSARRGARTVAGQAAAQGRRVSDTATRETTDLLDSAIEAVDTSAEPSRGSGRSYETWTKAELLDRAKELDVDGRSTMSKRQLITALRSA
jgi:hypothetical protein